MDRPKKVAIIGAGPAGITAAYELSKKEVGQKGVVKLKRGDEELSAEVEYRTLEHPPKK